MEDYQGQQSVDAEREPEPSKLDTEGQFVTLKTWVTSDMEALNNWRKNAKDEYSFVSGPGQWEAEAVQKLKDESRPVVTFNKTLKFVRAITGLEANNRQATTYLPRDVTNEGEVKANELLTSASDWMEAGCDAGRQQSRAFRDAVICGVGFTEASLSYDEDPQGAYVETRANPLEMGWDRNARDQNLSDARRIWRVRKMTIREARELLPGVTDDEQAFSDADLDASWAADVTDPREAIPKTQEQKELRAENMSGKGTKNECHIVHIQWWEFEPYIRTVDPHSQQQVDVSTGEFQQMSQMAQAMFGAQLPAAHLRRKVFKQAFVGGKILQVGPCPRGDGFTFAAVTWEPDDNEGTWFGITRVLKDPQTWSNKFFAQLMHIINSTAKGGILAEEDAFADIRQAQATYARPQAITVTAPGAIAKGKIMAKPGQGLTGGVMSLLQITDSMFSESTGMNMELMGLADRQQPGVLEAQRKQAAMTILATLFDSMSAFKKEVGRTRLFFIQNYLADGRLIRVHGEDGHQAIPLLQDKTMGRYDVIIDDAPTSPNMKEKAWGALQMVLPAFKDMLTPDVAVMLLDYVPHLPSKLIEGLKAVARKPPDPKLIEQKTRAAEAEIAKTEGAAEASKANALLSLAKAGSEQAAYNQAQLEALLHGVGLGAQAQLPFDGPEPFPPTTPPHQTLPELPEMGADAQTGGMAPANQPASPVVLPGGLNGARP